MFLSLYFPVIKQTSGGIHRMTKTKYLGQPVLVNYFFSDQVLEFSLRDNQDAASTLVFKLLIYPPPNNCEVLYCWTKLNHCFTRNTVHAENSTAEASYQPIYVKVLGLSYYIVPIFPFGFVCFIPWLCLISEGKNKKGHVSTETDGEFSSCILYIDFG